MLNYFTHRINKLYSNTIYESRYILTPSSRRILILGDSHCRVFDYIKSNNLIPEYYLKVAKIKGATARGLVNPNSKTNAINFFKKAVKRRLFGKTPGYILIQLGEVDCGYLIWYRAQKYQESISMQLNQSIEGYFKFVNWLIENTNSTIILSGVTPPTIRDDDTTGEIAYARREVKATQKERTELTLMYNEKIQTYVKSNKRLIYLAITEDFLNQQTGLVDDKFRNKNQFDHHLDSGTISQCWIDKILKIVEYQTN